MIFSPVLLQNVVLKHAEHIEALRKTFLDRWLLAKILLTRALEQDPKPAPPLFDTAQE